MLPRHFVNLSANTTPSSQLSSAQHGGTLPSLLAAAFPVLPALPLALVKDLAYLDRPRVALLCFAYVALHLGKTPPPNIEDGPLLCFFF